MKFDFKKQFSLYTNVDLLKILSEKDKYQPEAILAIKEILESRVILDSEKQDAEEFISNKSNQLTKINLVSNEAEKVIDSIFESQSQTKLGNWLKIILASIAIYYIYSLYTVLRYLFYLFNCSDCKIDIIAIGGVLNLVYIPIAFVLLFKKSKWGWAILFADTLFCFISGLSQIPLFYYYREFHNGSISPILFSIIIRIGFLVFLWRKDITKFFEVDELVKKRTLVVTSVISVLFILITYLFVN